MERRKKYKIGIKLPLVVFLLFAVFCSIQLRWLGKYYNQISKLEMPRSEASLKMENMLIAIGGETKNYLKNLQQKSLDNIDAFKKEFRDYQRVYYILAESGEEDLSADMIDKNYASLSNVVEELLNLHDLQVQKEALLNDNFGGTERFLNEAFALHSNPADRGGYEMLDLIMQIRNTVDTIRRNLDAYLRLNNAKYEMKIYASQNELDSLVGQYNELHIEKGDKEWLESFDKARNRNMLLVQEIVALEKKKILHLEQFGRLQQALQFVLDNNQIKAHAQLDSIKYAGDKFLAICVLLNPIFAVLGLIIILISQAYKAIEEVYPSSKTDDTAIGINSGKLDTTIQIPPPKASESLADLVNSDD